MGDIAAAAGISRQALYLHFPTRTELLVATATYLDETEKLEERLAACRVPSGAVDHLNAFIEAWGNYIPETYGIEKALTAVKSADTGELSAAVDRQQAVHRGCQAAIEALEAEGLLSLSLSRKQATDLLWTFLSVRNWEQLRIECDWSQRRYIEAMKLCAIRTLLNG